MQYDVTGMSFSNQIKLNISKSKAVTKILSKKLYSVLTDLSNAMRKLSEKISFHRHFKLSNNVKRALMIKSSAFILISIKH